MATQFKAVGGGDFKIPFMSDNIGGFKINGTVFVGAGRMASTDGGAPTAVAGTPNRDFN
jgi:hypothetical protein